MTQTMPERTAERELLPPLLEWLRLRKTIRDETRIIEELPWRGRRVDLVTVTRTGICSAYELKLGDTRRALEQSSLNSLSFERSFIVVAATPNKGNLEQAKHLGIGVIQIDLATGIINRLLIGRRNSIDASVRLRLRGKIDSGAGSVYV